MVGPENNSDRLNIRMHATTRSSSLQNAAVCHMIRVVTTAAAPVRMEALTRYAPPRSLAWDTSLTMSAFKPKAATASKM